MAEVAHAEELWRELEGRAAPLLTLDLPATGILLEAGVGSAGVALPLAGMVGTAWIADSDPERLERLKRLDGAPPFPGERFVIATPAAAVRRFAPLDALLLSAGLADALLTDVCQALRPNGQLAVAVQGRPGAARQLKHRLLGEGLREIRIVAAWPSAAAPGAWVDLESAAAWATLQAHFRPRAGDLLRAALGSAWHALAHQFPNVTRRAFGAALPAGYVVGRR